MVDLSREQQPPPVPGWGPPAGQQWGPPPGQPWGAPGWPPVSGPPPKKGLGTGAIVATVLGGVLVLLLLLAAAGALLLAGSEPQEQTAASGGVLTVPEGLADAAAPPGPDLLAAEPAVELGSIWASPDGVWDVTYGDFTTRLTVLADDAGSDCRDQPLLSELPEGCRSWSSARLESAGGSVVVDAVLLAMPDVAAAEAAAARAQREGVTVELGTQGEVVGQGSLPMGAPYVLYTTARAAPGAPATGLEQEASDAVRATDLIATDAVVALLFRD